MKLFKMNISTVIVFNFVILISSIFAVPVRIRFPNERQDVDISDDKRTGRILLQPAIRENLRANPIVIFIPSEPLALAEPNQSLNAWQFYYPPGPPPLPPSTTTSSSLIEDVSSRNIITTTEKLDDKNNEIYDEDDGIPTTSPSTTKAIITTRKIESTTSKSSIQVDVNHKSISGLSTPSPVAKSFNPPDYLDGGWAPLAL